MKEFWIFAGVVIMIYCGLIGVIALTIVAIKFAIWYWGVLS